MRSKECIEYHNIKDETFISQVSSKLELFVGSDYKQLFNFVDVDWCQVMSKKINKAAPTLKIIIEAIRKTSGNLFQECPYFGGYEANLTISKSIVSLLPNGIYKVSVMARNEFDDDFFHVVGVVEFQD